MRIVLWGLNLRFQGWIIHEIWTENTVEGSIHGQISGTLPKFSRRDLWNMKRLCHSWGYNFRQMARKFNLYIWCNKYTLGDSWAVKRCNVWLLIYCFRSSHFWIFGTNIFWLRLIYDWVKSLLLCLSYWISGILTL